ncbi:MAG: hypothetical protein ABL994_20665, partial [Verrucomicrobiales bacterium]
AIYSSIPMICPTVPVTRANVKPLVFVGGSISLCCSPFRLTLESSNLCRDQLPLIKGPDPRITTIPRLRTAVSTIDSLTLSSRHNWLYDTPGENGIVIESGIKGSGTFRENAVRNFPEDRSAFVNKAGGDYQVNLSGNSFR